MSDLRYETLDSICSLPDCECIASWEPIIYTWPVGSKTIVKPTQFDVEMPLCDKHRMELKTSDFLCDEIWTGIVDWAFRNNKPIPDRMSAEVRFKKVDHEVMVH